MEVAIEKVHLQFNLTTLQFLRVANNFLYLITSTNIVYRVNLLNPSQLQTFQVTSPITNCWLHHNGSHLILETLNGYYYLNSGLKKLPFKFKISAICFNHTQDELQTGDFLIVVKNLIYYCNLSMESSVLHKAHKFDFPIDGITILDDVLYMMNGNNILTWGIDSIKDVFKKKANKTQINYVANSNNPSHFIHDDQKFIYFNDISTYSNYKYMNLTSSSLSPNSILSRYNVISYTPSAIKLTNILTNETHTSHIQLESNEAILHITADYSQYTYWIITNLSVYEICIKNESHELWNFFIEHKDYDEALATTTSAVMKNKILILKSNSLIETGNYESAVKYLAQTNESFGKVTLKFMENKPLLLTYLLSIWGRTENQIQLQLISTWIIELFIELDDERDTGSEIEKKFEKFLINNKSTLNPKLVYEVLLKYNSNKLITFAKLISDYKFILDYYIDKQLWLEALNIIQLYFTKNDSIIYKYSTTLLVNQPYETVTTWLKLTHLIQINHEKLIPALLTYNKNSISYENNQALRYLSSVLPTTSNKNIHTTYVTLLITYKTPDIITTNELNSEIIQFIKKSKSYDFEFTLRLCIQYRRFGAALVLLISIEMYEDALLLALENDLIDMIEFVLGSVDDYNDSGMFNDPATIGDIVTEFDGNKLKKKLWTLFISYLVESVREQNNLEGLNEALHLNLSDGDYSNNMQQILHYIIQNSKLSLREILDQFPDFSKINDFKSGIIESINEYNLKVNLLNLEIADVYKSFQRYESQLNPSDKDLYDLNPKVGGNFQIVEPGESCEICSTLLVSKFFIKFPCLHGFHKLCLVNYLIKNGDYKLKNLLISANHNSNANNSEEIEKINDKICESCILCGDLKINSIDDGFELTSKEWNL